MAINEDLIEQNLIELLKKQNYKYLHGSDLQRDKNSVVLDDIFKDSLKRLNPKLPQYARNEAYNQVLHVGSSDMMASNEKFHNLLCDGVTVEYEKDGETQGINVKLIDLETIKLNDFLVVNQFIIKENNNEKRLDVVLFINGLPLVIIELKNALDEKATLHRAYTQIQNYKTAVPSIFYYNSLTIISDGIDAKVSSLSAPFSRYLAWKSPDKKENGVLPELQIMNERMLDKKVLLNLIRFNTVFEKEEMKDEKTEVLSIVTIKKVAAYHQYYAVQKAIHKTIEAMGNSQKIGVVWHTQGSGKSLSMVFYTGQLVVNKAMKNPTIIILTDRNDLDDQLFSTFGNCISLLRQTPIQATSREDLKKKLNVSGGGIVFTTIQKFSDETGEISNRDNIIVVADEAHRSQYGFTGRVDKDGDIKYGSAKYLRDALPKASFIGFTGTPIENDDKSTPAVFGKYIDIYDISQAVRDGATVPIHYESRLVKIKLNKEVTDKIDDLIDGIDNTTEGQIEKYKSKNTQINAIVGHPDRLKDVANDIVTHFEARQELFEGKGMIVCMTRQIAVDLYKEIINLRGDWHNDELDKGKIKVVMTSTTDDPESYQPHSTTKKDRKLLSGRIKDIHDELELVIVQSMWLTGFDCPPMHTMYIDKKMKGANLMQAIARVNRVYKDKPGGLIVDYIGIGQDLRNAMMTYVQAGGKGEATLEKTEVIAGMKSKFEVIEQIFNTFDYLEYFKTDNISQKLQVLMKATNFILSDEELKNRFLSELTSLTKLYVMSVPSLEAEQLRDGIAFFQAIKSRINKFTPSGFKSDIEIDTAIKQIVDDALTTDGVVNILDEVGIKAPSLDILSDEFLLEVKNMEHKNLSFELLKKLINDEVTIRKAKSIVQGKKFSEMLESVIKRYHNNQIDTAQVIEELSNIAREMKLEDKKSDELGLTPEEYAFYMILSQNSSTEFLEDYKMKELIHLIVDIIRKNATVDWEKRDDVKAKLRLLVKKVLMRYGYPPDMAKLEADKVLEQSELLASEFIDN
ncbi:type I restriction endonuclease subunit R [Sulfurimonas sp. SAG-AH-194-C21]|nr:type I restriction endonuclease subunit R [Sulfurimonas sp. SAG-AH-194-C21]MDF1882898.1 type I restriction endonuclease subunit R [Sulfurimonas sp. SAG-AH-194-C21]